MIRYTALFLLSLFCITATTTAQTRADSLDVLHYELNLNITDFPGKTITGHAELLLQPLLATNIIYLDLSSLTVDSVKLGTSPLSISHNGRIIEINLGTTYQPGDSLFVNIFYSGTPETDPSNWGGFYFNSADAGYAFNLGVGFTVDPHAYGRAWFPCNDVFSDKATYNFHITTQNNHKAFCNGLLVGQLANPDGTRTWSWQLADPIPTYLASVAVADYETIEFQHQGHTHTFPVVYGVPPADTAKMRGSFRHIHEGIDAFETGYGPYRWQRVGFVVVPFTGGAMEHSTNIAYPRFAVDGGLNYETLWAHELSHQWWGNLVTCETAEDMWINEGWAVFSEALFLEKVYNRQAYLDEVRSNHFFVQRWAHVYDDGFRALYPMPHEYTYGRHSYNKGGDVAHTLRSYLGDSAFFPAIHALMDSFAYSNINSYQMRDFLQRQTGKNLVNFFDGWVFEAGYPHFSIGNYASAVGDTGTHKTIVHVRQRQRQTNFVWENVPLQVTFIDNAGNKEVHEFVFNGGTLDSAQFILNFLPVFVGLDIDGLISDAITQHYAWINATGTVNFPEALMDLQVEQVQDSAFVFIEHNWVAPDPFKQYPQGIRLSNARYWKVSGIFPQGFSARGVIDYDARTPAQPASGYLDHTWLTGSEDSIVVLHRANPQTDWQVVTDVQKFIGLPTDLRGRIFINNLQRGEYTLGRYDISAGTKPTDDRGHAPVKIFPNPSTGSINIHAEDGKLLQQVYVHNLMGKLVQSHPSVKQQQMVLKSLATGSYLVSIVIDGKKFTKQVVVQ